MRLLVNASSVWKGGSLQNAKSFIEECRKFPEHQFYVVLNSNLIQNIEVHAFPRNFKFFKLSCRPAAKLRSLAFSRIFFRELEEKVRPDVVFTTSGPAYWRPRVPHVVGYNLPHYVYPESPFFNVISPKDRMKWKIKGHFVRFFFRTDADAYVVQTDDVNARLKKWLGRSNVFTVSNTCSSYYFAPPERSNKLPQKKRGEYRLLVMSRYYRHKNLEIIPRVLGTLGPTEKERVRFVLTINGDLFRALIPRNYYRNVVNLGPIRVEEGPGLYKECDALFLPTLLECFSASYAEAMAMQRPILTSDLGFARSICGNAAMYFDPLDPVDIGKKIAELMHDRGKQNELVERGKLRLRSFLSPEKRAEKYLSICAQFVSK